MTMFTRIAILIITLVVNISTIAISVVIAITLPHHSDSGFALGYRHVHDRDIDFDHNAIEVFWMPRFLGFSWRAENTAFCRVQAANFEYYRGLNALMIGIGFWAPSWYRYV